MKIANPNPPLCSGCYAQKPNAVHVDFEAAWDGPNFKDGVMGENGEVSNGIPVSIDDLVLCADCLKAAHALLPADEDEQAEVERLAVRVAELEGEAVGREEYVGKLEAAFESKQDRQRAKAPRLARR